VLSGFRNPLILLRKGEFSPEESEKEVREEHQKKRTQKETPPEELGGDLENHLTRWSGYYS